MVRKRISLVTKNVEDAFEDESEDHSDDEMASEEEVSSDGGSDSESEGDESAVSEDEYEESRKKRKSTKKKSASKKKMTKLSGGRTKLRTGKADPKGRGGSGKQKTTNSKSESIIVRKEDLKSIFSTVRKSYDAIDATVNEWIELYQEDAQEAIATLLTFVVHSSGCVNGSIEVEDLNPEKLQEKLNDLIDKFPSTDDYPVVSSHPTFKQFDRHFACFWSILIENCSETIIFDESFSEDFLECLSTIAKHHVRSFRHTATLAGYFIIDQLIQSIKDQKRQLNKAEKRKSNKSSQRQIDALNEQIETMEKIIGNIFHIFFEERYKDTAPDIRGLGVEALGGWILKYPDTFLADKYLRYFGWLLADKHSGVRELVLKQLLKIYSREEWHGQLNKFTKRYISRIVEIAVEDISIPVSINAIQLATLLLQHSFFDGAPKEDEYITSIESLLFDENALRRQSAAEFIQSNLSINMQQKTRRRSAGKKFKKQNPTLDDYLHFITEHSASIPNVASHVVDNFWSSEVFLQWKALTDKLNSPDINEVEEENIIKTLRAAVQKLYLNGEGLYNFNKDAHTKNKKSSSINHHSQMDDMTSHLAKVLPGLLQKYQSEKDKILPLLEIPQYFLLDSYDTHQLQQNFDELISLLKSLFWKHTDSSIHSAIAKTFSCFLRNHEYSLLDKTKKHYNALLREMEEKLIEAISQFEVNESTDTENQNTLSIALQRISTFVSVADIQIQGIIYQLMRLLRARGDGAYIYDSSAQSIMNIIFTTLCYRLYELVKQKEKTMSITYEELFNNAMEFKSQLVRIIKLEEDTSFEIRLYAYYRFCDLVTLFNLYAKGSTLRSLSLLCDDDEILTISNFFQYALAKELDDQDNRMVDEGDIARSKPVEMRKRFIIASIARLITVGEFDKSIAKYVLSHFASSDKCISSSVKYFWKDLKDKYPYEASQFEVDSMKVLFDKYLQTKSQDSFLEFMKLGMKFAQTHFPGRNVDMVENVLRDAIQIAISGTPIETSLEFLQGFQKHIGRLDGSSISHIKGYLQQEKRLLPTEVRENEAAMKELDKILAELELMEKKKRKSSEQHIVGHDGETDKESELSATRQLHFQTDSEKSESRKRKRSEVSDIEESDDETRLEGSQSQASQPPVNMEEGDATSERISDIESEDNTNDKRKRRRLL